MVLDTLRLTKTYSIMISSCSVSTCLQLLITPSVTLSVISGTSSACNILQESHYALRNPPIDDVPEMVDAFHEAFAEDVINVLCFKDIPEDIRRRGDVEHFSHVFSCNDGYFFKAIDISRK